MLLVGIVEYIGGVMFVVGKFSFVFCFLLCIIIFFMWCGWFRVFMVVIMLLVFM